MNHMPPGAGLMAEREVNRAIGELRRGVAVILDRMDAGRLAVLSAETATPATLAEFLAASDGEATLLLAAARAMALGLLAGGQARPQAVIGVPVDAARLDVLTLRGLADPTAPQPGVLPPPGAPWPGAQPQAAINLAKLASLLPAVLTARARPVTPTLLGVGAGAVLAYPAAAAAQLGRASDARMPLEEAEDVRVIAFRPPDGGVEHLAILVGRPEEAAVPLVRIHSECFTGDILGSRRCDCGPQLHQAIRRMGAEGAGVVLYMAQEGRGIGLVNKLRAYTLQDGGLDTLDANHALGYGADERSFAPAAAMLRQLGIARVRLLTNNPAKVAGLAAHGIEVAGRLSHAIAANGENDAYLATKARRFGHLLE